jgi:pimeloyl-ACP methyl ester carboxylesterase
MDTMMDPTAQQLELPDGRLLGYAEFGSSDGPPIFYNHGFPASRLEARLVEKEAAELGLRLIAVDRPGIGLSSLQPGRTLLDWPADIARLADHLGLPRFAMLGVSGGGPATLACACRLAERLTAVSIVCGLGEVAEPELLRLMNWPARFSFGMARRAPAFAGWLFGNCISPLLKRSPALTLRLLTVAAPPADAAVLRDDTIRQRLAGSMREAFRQGSRGPTAELALLAAPWPFKVAEIRLPIEFWHGRKDATVPFRHCEVLAKSLADVRCHEFLKDGHFSMPIRYAAAILGGLRDRHLERLKD